jgi:hypothetical protein
MEGINQTYRKENYQSMNFMPLAATASRVSLTSASQSTSSSFSICKGRKDMHTKIPLRQYCINHSHELVHTKEKSMAGKRVRHFVMLLLLSQGLTPCILKSNRKNEI